MHRILFHRNAVKFYRKADETLKERIADAIDVIARNPHLDGHIKKLKGDLKHMHRFGDAFVGKTEMASRLVKGRIDDGIFDNHLAHIGKIPYLKDLRTKYKTYKTPHSFRDTGL